MKKNFLYSVMALFAILLASCSQEEIISENSGNGKVTVSVGVPGGATTRAGMPNVDGVTRRCIMQVVDGNGTAITGLKETKEVTGETVTFSFDAPEGEYSVVFWADYVTNLSNDYIYSTEQLPIIGYKGTKNNMFANAGDAFCGKIAKGATSTTLKRPFNKIVVGSTNKEVFGEYTHIAIGNFNVPTGYSIMDGTCGNIEDTPSAPIRLEKKAINNAETGEWAYFYVFPAVDQTATDLGLNITLSKGAEDTAEKTNFVATIKSMPTDANTIGNVNIPEIPTTPPVDPEEPTKVDVVISFDDEFTNGGSTEPEEPGTPGKMKVGSYINAAGEVVADATNAVGIVFALEALNGDVTANYPEALKNKTIKGYAVAISNANPARQQIIAANETLSFTMPENPTNGTQTTEALLTGIGTDKAFVTTYNTWVSEHALTGANLSAWYIPTIDQLKYFANMLFTIGSVAPIGSTEFKNLPEFAFENGKLYDRTPIAAVSYTSSSINDNGNISVVTFNTDGTAKAGQSAVTGTTKEVKNLCRPFLTIFGE